MLGRLGVATLALCTLGGCSGSRSAPVWATGSSTVYPFTKLVANAFVEADGNRATPTVESTGTNAGMTRFCQGGGSKNPDIVDASARMTRVEYAKCQTNKVGDIVEVPIGLDGIALAESNSGPKLELTRKDVYLALAANPMGKPNTARTWKDVNAKLPAIPIQLLGPPASSGTRDAFVELLLKPGCFAAMPESEGMQRQGDPAKFHQLCRTIRADGPYVERGEDDEAIAQALLQNPNALGLFGYSYLEENAAKLHAVPIEGIAPDPGSITTGKYAGVRPLYLYVKKRNLEKKKGVREFMNLYASMWGPDGLLAKRGLIAQNERVRRRAKEAIDLALPLDTTALP